MKHDNILCPDIFPDIPGGHCGKNHFRQAEREGTHNISHNGCACSTPHPKNPIEFSFFKEMFCQDSAAFLDRFKSGGAIFFFD